MFQTRFLRIKGSGAGAFDSSVVTEGTMYPEHVNPAGPRLGLVEQESLNTPTFRASITYSDVGGSRRVTGAV